MWYYPLRNYVHLLIAEANLMSQEKDVDRLTALIPTHLKRRVQSKLALQGKTLTSLVIELLEQWLADQDREQATAT